MKFTRRLLNKANKETRREMNAKKQEIKAVKRAIKKATLKNPQKWKSLYISTNIQENDLGFNMFIIESATDGEILFSDSCFLTSFQLQRVLGSLGYQRSYTGLFTATR